MYHNTDIHGVTVHLQKTDIHNVTVHLSGKTWLCGATERVPAYYAALGSKPRSSTTCSVYLCESCKRLYRKDNFKLEPIGSKSELNETCERYLQLEEIKVKKLLAPVLGHNCCIYPRQKEKLKPRNWYHTRRSLVPPVMRYNPLY